MLAPFPPPKVPPARHVAAPVTAHPRYGKDPPQGQLSTTCSYPRSTQHHTAQQPRRHSEKARPPAQRRTLLLELEVDEDLSRLQPALAERLNRSQLHTRVLAAFDVAAKRLGVERVNYQLVPSPSDDVKEYDSDLNMNVPLRCFDGPEDVDGYHRLMVALRPNLLPEFFKMLYPAPTQPAHGRQQATTGPKRFGTSGAPRPAVLAMRSVRRFSSLQAPWVTPYGTGGFNYEWGIKALQDESLGDGWILLLIAGKDAGPIIVDIAETLVPPLAIDERSSETKSCPALPPIIFSRSPEEAYYQIRASFRQRDLKSLGRLFHEYTVPV